MFHNVIEPSITLSTSTNTCKCQVLWYNLASPKSSAKIVTLCSGHFEAENGGDE